MLTSRPASAVVVVFALLASGAAALPPLSLDPVDPVAVPTVLPGLILTQVATGLSSPVGFANAGDGSDRIFIIEQRGTIREIDGGALDPVFYLDIRSKVSCCGERGLLGLAFDPDFETNGRVFVSYTGLSGQNVLERYQVAAPATGRPDPASGVVLLQQSQPFSNHNGGGIVFGPDGYLYMGIGDGGSAGDPQGNGQNLNTLLGKILRIDVSGTGYTIPADNPFASGGGRAEIWGYGLRNPWRFSFDRMTGDLFIADVGQNLIEEINFQPAGAVGGRNYGWRLWEGHNPYGGLSAVNANALTMTFPVAEYPHSVSCSITGGYVSRGPSQLLEGMYIFGDFCSGVISALVGEDGVYAQIPVIVDTQYQITSFGEDESGVLYVVHYGGQVYRIEAP